MTYLVFDPSGNFKEGKGTSGVAIFKDGEPAEIFEIKADNFDSADAYWDAHVTEIATRLPDQVIMEGYRLYNHKGMKASTQANSDLETPQLLGVLKHTCFSMVIPYRIQYAADVKTRWSDKVLVNLGILEERNGRYYFKGKMTNAHMRDALRHGLHYGRYGKRD